MCCRGLAKFYLTFLSTLTALVGLAVIAASSYSLAEFDDIQAILSRKALYAVLAAGVLLFLFSLLGCCASKSQNRCGLLVYVLGVLAVGALQIIGGAVIADYAGDLQISNGNIDGLTSEVQDFVTCSYYYCCGNESASCDTNVWNSDGFCKILPDDLSNPSSQQCSSESEFNQALVDWLHDNERTIAIAALALGGVELLAVFFGVYLMCSSKPKTPEQIEQEQRIAAQSYSGGQLVYGSAQPASAGQVRYAV